MAARVLHGVNLAGWLTLEPWVTPRLFADSGALDEDALIASIGTKRYRELISEHRRSFLSQKDFTSIASRGFNAVRLAVPWYVFGDAGPDSGPFVGCLEYVDEAFLWAEDIDLKIVLALAVIPGSKAAGTDFAHDREDFSRRREAMLVVLGALAKRYSSRMALAGIEVADGVVAQTRRGFTLSDGVPLHQVRNYYREAYESIRTNASDVTVILPDAGMPGSWRRFMPPRRYENVWLDSHLYHYRDHIDSVGPTGIRMLSNASRESMRLARKSGLPVMVGKWSASLPFPDSATTPEGRIALERVYISEQLAIFKSCPAWFFNTWKTDKHLDGWDARVALSSFERAMLT